MHDVEDIENLPSAHVDVTEGDQVGAPILPQDEDELEDEGYYYAGELLIYWPLR